MNSVSIRSLSDGHSFSAKQIATMAEELGMVLIPSAKSIAVPREYADASSAVGMLRDCAMSPAPNERVIVTPDADGVAVAMAVSNDVAEQLNGRIAVSPLQVGGDFDRGVSLWLSRGVAFVRVYDNGLRLAEAVDVATMADLRYVLELLDATYNIYSTRARVTADSEPWIGSFVELSKMMNQLFKDVVCEL